MTRVLRLAGMIAIPAAGALAAFVLADLLLRPITAVPSLDPALTTLGFGLSVMAGGALAAAVGRRWSGSQPTWTVPLLLSAGLAIAMTCVALVDAEAEHLAGYLVAVAVWGVVVGAGLAIPRAVGRRSRVRAAVVAGVAAVVAADLAVIVAGVVRVDAAEAPRAFAPLWYPGVAFNLRTPFDRAAGLWILADQLTVLPVLLTVASAFAVGYGAGTRPGRRDLIDPASA